MKVFISWSKDLSREVAHALNWWLPQVLQSVQPFLSSTDIDAGRRWSSTIAGELQQSNFGILCVTRENRHEPWLNFEAGALAKNLDESYVVPLLIDLSPADLEGPLAQFQAVTRLDQAGIASVLGTLDGLTESPLGEARLADAVDVWWPRLEPKLDVARQGAADGAGGDAPLRDQREILEEVLSIVRNLGDGQVRMVPRPEGPAGGKSSGTETMRLGGLFEALRDNHLPVLDVFGLDGGKVSVTYGPGTPTGAQTELARSIAMDHGFRIVP